MMVFIPFDLVIFCFRSKCNKKWEYSTVLRGLVEEIALALKLKNHQTLSPSSGDS